MNLKENEMAEYKQHTIDTLKLFDTDKINDAWESVMRKKADNGGEYSEKVISFFTIVVLCPFWTGEAV